MSIRNVLLLSFAILPFLTSCGGSSNNSSPGGSSSATGASASGDSTYKGDGSLSYTVDGRHVSIKDYLVKDGQNRVALFLNEVSNDAAKGMVRVNLTNYLTKEVFNFKVANKGTTTIAHYAPSLLRAGASGVYMSPKYNNYYADSVTVTITSLGASRISGTFSGLFKADKSDGNGFARVTDGQFDVPLKAGISY